MNMVKVFFRKVIFTVNKLIPLPTPIFRLCWRFFYQKESFVNWNSQMILLSKRIICELEFTNDSA